MLQIKNFYFQERDELMGFIRAKGLRPTKILLTHAHFDHVFGLKECAGMLGVPVYMDPADKETLGNAGHFCRYSRRSDTIRLSSIISIRSCKQNILSCHRFINIGTVVKRIKLYNELIANVI